MSILSFVGGLVTGMGILFFSMLYLGKAGLKAREEAIRKSQEGQESEKAQYRAFMDRQHNDLQQIRFYQEKTYEKMAAMLEELRCDSQSTNMGG